MILKFPLELDQRRAAVGHLLEIARRRAPGLVAGSDEEPPPMPYQRVGRPGLGTAHVQLAVLMGGVAAEREFTGTEMAKRPIANSDQQRVADVLALIDRRRWPSVLAQARQQVERLVTVHRSTISKVANPLLDRCAVAGEPQARLDGVALADLLDGPAVAILRAAETSTPAD